MMSSATSSIRPLPPEIAQQIKSSTSIASLDKVIAGLLKNSLEAGASRLDVDVDYGRGSCTVEDDGCGIPPSEFEEGGNLAKPHHTSKAHGCSGTFLSSVAALSILEITSHYRLNRSAATMTLHHSRPAARLFLAPLHQQLSCREHGTRVRVRDLFGNMAVRVKQRSMHLEDPKQEARDLDGLINHILGILLAWGSAVTLTVKTALGTKALHVRGAEAQLTHGVQRSDTVPAIKTENVRTILSQAGHIAPSDWKAWVHTSARSSFVSVEGAISLQPAPSKRTQFISIGIEHIDRISGDNMLYDEVNRLFAGSRFGNEDEALTMEETVAKTPDRRRKQGGFTIRQLKGGGKGIDRWPMFFLRVAIHEEEKRESESAVGHYREQNVLPLVLKVVRAMITRFLEDHQFLKRQKPKTIKPPNKPHVSPSFAQDVNRRSPTSRRTLPNHVDTKMPVFRDSQDQPRMRAFSAWSRIKSGKWEDLLEPLEHKPSAQRRPNERILSNANNAIIAATDMSVLDESRQVTDISNEAINANDSVEPHEHELGPHCDDDIIQWTNPISKATIKINSRTGLAVSQNSRALKRAASNAGTLHQAKSFFIRREQILPVDALVCPAVSEKTTWVNSILEKWENPTFGPPEERIPHISLDDSGLNGPPNLPRRNHQCSHSDLEKMFTESSAPDKTILSKGGLASARVIAQVDRKFVLIAMDKATVGKDLEQQEYQQNEILVLVDQHAADERIRVETLFAELCTPLPQQHDSVAHATGHEGLNSAITTTVLSKPIAFETTANERQLFADHASHFATWGILYQISPPTPTPRGPTSEKCRITVKALPEAIAERCRIDPKILIELLRGEAWKRQEAAPIAKTSNDASDGRRAEKWLSRISSCPQGIIEMINSRSCRSAIMFNDELSVEQCQSLVRRLARCAFPFQCAHGRPSMVPLVDITADLEVGVSGGFGARGFRRKDVEAEGEVGFGEAWKRRGVLGDVG